MKYAIQPRDEKILLRIYRWRFMTREQIERLFFPSKQAAKNRILALKRYGLIDELNVLQSQSIFRLTNRGEAVLSQQLAVSSRQLVIRKIKMPDKRFLRHHIELNDFWGALIESVQKIHEFSLPMFLPYYLGTNEGFNQRITECQNADSVRYADAIFILTKKGESQLFILEIDRGTQGISGGVFRHGKVLSRVFGRKKF